jgi:hypothetical protein
MERRQAVMVSVTTAGSGVIRTQTMKMVYPINLELNLPWTDFNLLHDGLDSHVGTFNFERLGIPLATVKNGVPLKFHQVKDTKELRVRPYHCFAPHKVFMTEDEIYQNMLRPSEIVEHVDSSVQPWCQIAEPELSQVERVH